MAQQSSDLLSVHVTLKETKSSKICRIHSEINLHKITTSHKTVDFPDTISLISVIIIAVVHHTTVFQKQQRHVYPVVKKMVTHDVRDDKKLTMETDKKKTCEGLRGLFSAELSSQTQTVIIAALLSLKA